MTLKITVGDKTVTQKKTLKLEGAGVSDLQFEQTLARPEPADDKQSDVQLDAVFELTVASGERRDVTTRSIPLLPYGMPIFATTGGSAEASTTAWIEAPKGVVDRDRSLSIVLGPTVERSLLDVLFGPAPYCQVRSSRWAPGLDGATSDLMAALALQRLIGATRDADGPQAQLLDGQIRSSLSTLVSAQNDDGGWSWTGAGGAVEPHDFGPRVVGVVASKSGRISCAGRRHESGRQLCRRADRQNP